MRREIAAHVGPPWLAPRIRSDSTLVAKPTGMRPETHAALLCAAMPCYLLPCDADHRYAVLFAALLCTMLKPNPISPYPLLRGVHQPIHLLLLIIGQRQGIRQGQVFDEIIPIFCRFQATQNRLPQHIIWLRLTRQIQGFWGG
jgi:hypothetical protein